MSANFPILNLISNHILGTCSTSSHTSFTNLRSAEALTLSLVCISEYWSLKFKTPHHCFILDSRLIRLLNLEQARKQYYNSEMTLMSSDIIAYLHFNSQNLICSNKGLQTKNICADYLSMNLRSHRLLQRPISTCILFYV